MDELLDALKGKFVLNKIESIDGKVKISGKYDAQGVDLELALYVEFDVFLNIVKGLIPGSLDDMIIDTLKPLLLGYLVK